MMKVQGLSLILLCVTSYGSCQSQQDLAAMFTYRKLRIVCSRGVPFRFRLLESECCKEYNKLMETFWKNGDRYLSEHLEFLRTWRCPQLSEQCEKRTYAFNEFTSLVYDHFCNETLVSEKCSDQIYDIVGEPPQIDSNASSMVTVGNSRQRNLSKWKEMIELMDPDKLQSGDYNKPCVQIAQFGSSRGGFGSFQEILSASVPFCSIVWCGFSRDVIERGASLYDCLPVSCRIKVVIIVLVTFLLSLAIIFANLLVIIIFGNVLRCRNAQAVYKISMAVADLLTGIIVMPCFAITMLLSTQDKVTLATDYTLKLPEFSNQFVDWSKVPMHGRDAVTVRAATRLTLNKGYINAVGCITTISLLASIYTLACASIDRLCAVHFPLRYRASDTKKYAQRLLLANWLLIILISLMPFMGIGFKYGPISSVIITLLGENVHILYICVFLVPIAIVWISNVILYLTVQKQSIRRQGLSSGAMDQQNENKKDRRLATTLLFMVGVFTLCVLPIAIMAIISIALSSELDPSNLTTFQLSRLLLLNSVDYIVGIILLCNSFWNVVIYSLRNKEFKKSAKTVIHDIFCCVCLRKYHRKFGNNSIASSHSSKTDSNVRTAMTTVQKSAGDVMESQTT